MHFRSRLRRVVYGTGRGREGGQKTTSEGSADWLVPPIELTLNVRINRPPDESRASAQPFGPRDIIRDTISPRGVVSTDEFLIRELESAKPPVLAARSSLLVAVEDVPNDRVVGSVGDQRVLVARERAEPDRKSERSS